MDDGFLDLAFPSTQQQYETLDEIDDELARGELHAFGRPDQRWAIMEHVELIKSKQLEIFDQLTNMELPLEIALKKEARTAQHNSASAGGFHSDDFCEKFKAAFEERDSVVANISSDLEGLCTIVDDINHKTKELAPPRTAQVGAEGGGGGGSGGGGGGTAPSKQRGT